MSKLVVIDGYTLNPGDLSWGPIEALDLEVVYYEDTSVEQVVERCKDASVVLTNKVAFDAAVFAQLPYLKYVGVTATGYNVVDIEAAKQAGVKVSNVRGYSTPAVVQQVFALLLEMTNQVALNDKSVKAGEWASSKHFCYWKQPIDELFGKTFGIYGFGSIGQAVAVVAQAFGMNVIAYHKHPERDARQGVTFVSEKELLEQSDILTLHAPMNERSANFINADSLKLMKSTSYLINTARGGLIDEVALYEALKSQEIAGAGLDVLKQEPALPNHPLTTLSNCVITPHVAWASQAARRRLMDLVAENIAAYLNGESLNLLTE